LAKAGRREVGREGAAPGRVEPVEPGEAPQRPGEVLQRGGGVDRGPPRLLGRQAVPDLPGGVGGEGRGDRERVDGAAAGGLAGERVDDARGHDP
jgi:hypothetical protein